MSKSDLYQLLNDRILVLDGAMGTMIQSYNLSELDFRSDIFNDHTSDLKGCNDLLSLTRPDIIKEIHNAYFEAGADIVETNTFNSNGPGLADYNLEHEVYHLNFESARLATECAVKFSEKTSEKKVCWR